MNKRFISLDLELEQPNTKPQTRDSKVKEATIIQVGLTVFELNFNGDINILENVEMNINYKYKISHFIKKLTNIKDEDCNNSPFTINDAREKMRELKEKYQTEDAIIEWGSGDTKALFKGVKVRDYGFSFPIDVKKLYQNFAIVNDMKPRSGLSKSMAKMGVIKKDNFQFLHLRYEERLLSSHNALCDAYNTARIYNKLLSHFNLNKGT
jgi:inhibitor of KinA sporulation pathway (predicted exonuclease)